MKSLSSRKDQAGPDTWGGTAGAGPRTPRAPLPLYLGVDLRVPASTGGGVFSTRRGAISDVAARLVRNDVRPVVNRLPDPDGAGAPDVRFRSRFTLTEPKSSPSAAQQTAAERQAAAPRSPEAPAGNAPGTGTDASAVAAPQAGKSADPAPVTDSAEAMAPAQAAQTPTAEAPVNAPRPDTAAVAQSGDAAAGEGNAKSAAMPEPTVAEAATPKHSGDSVATDTTPAAAVPDAGNAPPAGATTPGDADARTADPAKAPETLTAQPQPAENPAAPEAQIADTVDTGTDPDVAPGAAKAPAAQPATARQSPKSAPGRPGAEDVTARSGGAGMGAPIEGETGPIMRRGDGSPPSGGGGNGGRPPPPKFHKRQGPQDFAEKLRTGAVAVRRNLFIVMILTLATNLLILSIPIYLFQISDRVLTSRSTDTLIMLTVIIVGAVILQTCFDALRRFILMRTAVEVAVRLGAPILSAAAHASLHGTGREYQTLGDLQQLRGFLTSGTLLAFLDVPFAPLFVLAIYFVHPHLGSIVVISALLLALIAYVNQRLTHKPFSEASKAQSSANGHLESMARNSQIINALAMIPEAVMIWGRDTAASLTAQVQAQDRNIVMSAVSRAVRLLTQVAMLGWGAFLAIEGQITGGMVIAASIIAGRALAPIEGSIEGWNSFIIARQAYDRIRNLLVNSKLQYEKLNLPQPEGRLDVERLLYVPSGTKHVVLNAISFSLNPGESLAVIGNSGAGKTTLGKMLVGSVLPTSGNVRLDLMDLRNWDPRQLGENIGYLPQDVQLFPGTIKDNIGRMRKDATDEQIYRAAMLADVHEMIANLPHGYETYVQADGFPLSGGQKQRIALARAFFGDPRFVVLDEPNSNLDTKGDKALAQALQHAKRNKITVVVITQKPSLLSVVDKIMLLADGTVQMFGERTPVLQELAGRKAPQNAGQNRMQPPPTRQTLPNGDDNG